MTVQVFESVDDASYDAMDNFGKCYDLAIREIRMHGIRNGKYHPIPSRPEEMMAALEASVADKQRD